MGVAGDGKSTVGAAIARGLDWPFFDGDRFHPTSNVEKMAAGIPLSDEDRIPWLESLHFDFQIVGDLTIRDVTRQVTFDLTVTIVSDTRLQGLGTATIMRSDFDLGLIRLPSQVALVEEEIIIEIEFVAERVD